MCKVVYFKCEYEKKVNREKFLSPLQFCYFDKFYLKLFLIYLIFFLIDIVKRIRAKTRFSRIKCVSQNILAKHNGQVRVSKETLLVLTANVP